MVEWEQFFSISSFCSFATLNKKGKYVKGKCRDTTDMLLNKTPVFMVKAYKYTIVFTFFVGTQAYYSVFSLLTLTCSYQLPACVFICGRNYMNSCKALWFQVLHFTHTPHFTPLPRLKNSSCINGLPAFRKYPWIVMFSWGHLFLLTYICEHMVQL